MSEDDLNNSNGSESVRLLALCVALLAFIVSGWVFLAGLAIYAAWYVHWSIGVGAALIILLVAIPEGSPETYDDHTPW